MLKRLVQSNQKQTNLNLKSTRITQSRLIKFCKLGKPPASAADIKSILRNLIQTNPIAFESRIKDVIGTTEGFNEQNLEETISKYNADQNDQAFEEVFNSISEGLNEAINRRRQKAEEIGRRNGYQVQNLGNNTFQVKDLDDQDVYKVELNQETCTCLDWQRISPLSLWCKHEFGVWSQTQNLQDIS
jgi:hypothetical protein